MQALHILLLAGINLYEQIAQTAWTVKFIKDFSDCSLYCKNCTPLLYQKSQIELPEGLVSFKFHARNRKTEMPQGPAAIHR